MVGFAWAALHSVAAIFYLLFIFDLFFRNIGFFNGDMVVRFGENCYWDVAIANRGNSRFV